MTASTPGSGHDPFDVGKLVAEFAEVKERVESIEANVGHMPGSKGFDDPGAGAMKMLAEMRSASQQSARRHAAWGGLAAAILVTLVKVAEGLGFIPTPAPSREPAPVSAPAPAR